MPYLMDFCTVLSEAKPAVPQKREEGYTITTINSNTLLYTYSGAAIVLHA
jgi:hypothetical protein